MDFRHKCPARRNEVCQRPLGFTLIEVVISIAILALVMSGLIYGYVQANWVALWSSMSLAAQSFASEGAEQARAADWRPRDYPPASGPGTMDEWPSGTSITHIGQMDIPGDTSTNNQFSVTNLVTVTDVSINPPIRQIRSECYWVFARDNILCTNTVILLRASDQ
jgi:prepilin-type N-terminal cleavage/methylation domain-containing protein